jgi:mRNA interferase MazF
MPVGRGAIALEPFDVVIVPFPFTDRQASKRRPALVLSGAAFNAATRHCVLAMITSAEQSHWQGDCPITHLTAAGLHTACIVRPKLFTLDQRLVLRVNGKLAEADRKRLRTAWKGLLALA